MLHNIIFICNLYFFYKNNNKTSNQTHKQTHTLVYGLTLVINISLSDDVRIV
jgi:hypothetical protein